VRYDGDFSEWRRMEEPYRGAYKSLESAARGGGQVARRAKRALDRVGASHPK
jgi:hypothetical protein